MVEVALVILLGLVLVLRYLENESARKERDRLVRIAFAESHAERIAAVLPDRKPKAAAKRSSAEPAQPSRPLGI